MPEQLAYVILTPYSLYKSRTGGILARLMTRSGLEWVAARMFAPSQSLIDDYASAIVSANDPQDRKIQELIQAYVLKNFGPDQKTGKRRRVMMLLFKGEDAAQKIRAVVGHIASNRRTGETIRDTFGDFIAVGEDVHYFEPAVLAAPNAAESESKLKLWTRYSDSDGGLVENTVDYPPGTKTEKTLVLIKPDNFRFPTGRPGNVIDFFSRTGLSIVGIKVHRMSVNEAVEFYGPVKDTLKTKLGALVGARAKGPLEEEFGFPITPDTELAIGNALCPLFGEHRFEEIVKFMAGRAPSKVTPSESSRPGSETCIAIIYEGPDAVAKIRAVLGPTDPSKAPPGSIRREFGQSIMVNAAHASDSPESVEREMKIIHVGENRFKKVVEEFYGPSTNADSTVTAFGRSATP